MNFCSNVFAFRHPIAHLWWLCAVCLFYLVQCWICTFGAGCQVVCTKVCFIGPHNNENRLIIKSFSISRRNRVSWKILKSRKLLIPDGGISLDRHCNLFRLITFSVPYATTVTPGWILWVSISFMDIYHMCLYLQKKGLPIEVQYLQHSLSMLFNYSISTDSEHYVFPALSQWLSVL